MGYMPTITSEATRVMHTRGIQTCSFAREYVLSDVLNQAGDIVA